MSHNDPTVYIELSDFKVLLAARVQEAKLKGLSVAEFARQVGIKRTLLYALMNGTRLPSEEVLRALGGRFVIAVGPPPKKPKKS